MKYIVEAGAFVAKIHRKRLTVFANSPEEAEEKARDRFESIEHRAGNDCGTVQIDSVEEAPNE